MLNHLNLTVSDAEAAAGFLTSYFGMTEMGRRNAKKGIASLCIGGGMGVALTIER